MIKVGILGSTGYTGLQLLKILAKHPEIEVIWITSEKFSNLKIADVFPHLRNLIDLDCMSISELDKFQKVDLVFSCLPNTTSMVFVQKLIKKGAKIIDLSSDFRINDLQIYESIFSVKHKFPDLIHEFEYGLPEVNKKQLIDAKLIANPGCFATSVLLAIIPFLMNFKLRSREIIVDIKSPISAAGRAPKLKHHFSETNQSVLINSSSGYSQKFEIKEKVKQICNRDINLIYSTHNIPLNRGIISTIYCKITKNISIESVNECYIKYYEDKPFLRVLENIDDMSLKSVTGSNFCDISLFLQDNHLIIISMLDNLIKGASGQAVQNMNLNFDLPETLGLTDIPGFP